MRKTNKLLWLENSKPFFSIALKQIKAGPRSSGTPVLVITMIIYIICEEFIIGVMNNKDILNTNMYRSISMEL